MENIYCGYSSPSPEELKIIDNVANKWSGRVEICKLIKDVRRGDLEWSSMDDQQREAFIELKNCKLIKSVFALPNPHLLDITKGDKEYKNDLNFIFVRAAPKNYLQVKECIRKYSEQHHCSAYTTLGPYDFVVRMVALESEKEYLKSLLRQTASDFEEEKEDDYGETEDNAYKVSQVTKVCLYNRERNIPITRSVKKMSDEDRRFLEDAHLSLIPDLSSEVSNKSIYDSLKKNNFILGTRCAVNSPMLREIVAFILVKGLNGQKVLTKLIKQENEATSDQIKLLDNVIDVFSLSGWGTYGSLLTCEFPCKGFCAWLLYNRWMDIFYQNIESRCLTFPSDSTIEQYPDNILGSKNRIVEKHYSSANGLLLGNHVYFGKELKNQMFIKPQWLCLGSASIGKSGSGKSNTCRQLLYGICDFNKKNGKETKILYVSFKGEKSIPSKVISELNGIKISGTEFMNVKSLDDFPRPYFVESAMGKEGEKVAKKCLQLIEAIIEQGDKKAGSPELKRIVVLDEICNVKDFNNLKAELETLLNTCRDSGIAIVVAHQDIKADFEEIWQKCHNLFLHGNNYSEAEISKIDDVHGLIPPIDRALSTLKNGEMVFWTDVEEIPAIVVKAQLRE